LDVQTLKDGVLPEAYSQEIYKTFATLAPVIEEAIRQLRAKQPEFAKLTQEFVKFLGQPSDVVISVYLDILLKAYVTLQDAFLGITPVSLATFLV
jgi:hypothetical protein